VGRKIVVVGGDLMAHERIRSAAGPAHAEVDFVSFGGLAPALESGTPDTLIVDLDDGRAPVLREIEGARAAGTLPNRVLGYYSHVDTELGRAAEAAGVTPVRRGHFWSSLPSLLS
jgi:hypothetical protein